jgi:predicted nucleic acid-binding protein
LLALLPIGQDATAWNFLRRYHEIEPDLADAALVYLAEREDIPTIFTLEQRDFSIYHYRRNRRLENIPSHP